MIKVDGLEIEVRREEFGVEYYINDEGPFVSPADDEQQANMHAAVLDGVVVIKSVFETGWAIVNYVDKEAS